ncbi:hypothetical protein ACFQ2B_19525 [Streptomyces stramineus]
MSMRTRVAGVLLAAMAGGMVLSQAGTATADDHRGHGLGPLPVAIVSPAPGKITKERKITDTYQYDAKGGSSSEEQPPPPPAPPRRPPPSRARSPR